MRKKYTFAALRTPILMMFAVVPAQAQSPDADITPRQVFTSFVSGQPLSDLKFKPIGETLVIINTLPPGTAVAERVPEIPAPAETPFAFPIAKNPAENPPVPELVKAPEADETGRAEIAPPAAPKTKPAAMPAASVPLLPFYISAADYLDARGTGKSKQLKLRYKVTINNPKSTLTVAPTSRTVTLGPDFAAVEEDDKIRIFDFKQDRLLTLHATEDGTVFDNISLYAAAFKTVNTVSTATQNGKLESINIGEGETLDAFWLEASLGWAARGMFGSLETVRDGDKLTSSYKTLSPFSADLSGPEMPTENHMRTLFAWWQHDLPIHPAILPEIGRPDHAPESMEILSFSPKFPDGLTATWELTKSETLDAPFPLPAKARTSVEAEKSTPLAFVISKAASGDALNLRPTPGDLRQEILEKREAGKDFEAWLTAQSLADRLGGCDVDPALLCKDISDLEENAAPGSDLSKLPKIIRQSRTAATRVSAFEALYPYVSDEIAPAFLVKIAGQARARIKSSALSETSHQDLKADRLLEEALVKNPYDPVIYQTLGQVYAAQGRIAESWDIQDAMRRLPDVTEKQAAAINRAERTIRDRAPGFFIKNTP